MTQVREALEAAKSKKRRLRRKRAKQSAENAVAQGHHFMDDFACPACGTDSSVGCVWEISR